MDVMHKPGARLRIQHEDELKVLHPFAQEPTYLPS